MQRKIMFDLYHQVNENRNTTKIKNTVYTLYISLLAIMCSKKSLFQAMVAITNVLQIIKPQFTKFFTMGVGCCSVV